MKKIKEIQNPDPDEIQNTKSRKYKSQPDEIQNTKLRKYKLWQNPILRQEKFLGTQRDQLKQKKSKNENEKEEE